MTRSTKLKYKNNFSDIQILYFFGTGQVFILPKQSQQEAQMGLISLTWVFCHNLVKIHLEVIKTLSFSCSVILLVKTNGKNLAVPNCKKKKKKKKSKWLNAKIIVIQSWYNSNDRFFSVLYFAIFSKGCHLDRSILRTHCRYHFDKNLVKIH